MGNEAKIIRVSQKAIIVDGQGKILTIKRTETAPSWPLHWDLPGGELEFGENTIDGITREIKEETGLRANNFKILDVYSGFDDINEFWLTICYVASAEDGEVKLSFEHNDYKWVSADEFQTLEASPKNKAFVKLFKQSKK
ncbi:MAG: NUDIX hydrolase [Candidatus Staskawiczbacteria bacterium]|nr:NUDIX hydrolase [Candidatus Staskawiczbacteria bacterium]